MKLDLDDLESGDVLVCRNGTRRNFKQYIDGKDIESDSNESPMAWWNTGRWTRGHIDSFDIVRVIRKRRTVAERKDDRDATWMFEFIDAKILGR